jgi:hypothetical protein
VAHARKHTPLSCASPPLDTAAWDMPVTDDHGGSRVVMTVRCGRPGHPGPHGAYPGSKLAGVGRVWGASGARLHASHMDMACLDTTLALRAPTSTTCATTVVDSSLSLPRHEQSVHDLSVWKTLVAEQCGLSDHCDTPRFVRSASFGVGYALSRDTPRLDVSDEAGQAQPRSQSQSAAEQ